MKSLPINFGDAATDYLYFLDRRYPQKASLKLIGDRYRLSGIERSMLFRGISTSGIARTRNKKLVSDECVSGNWLMIDVYNTLITLGSYLNGNVVFISNDGIIRDASEVHGKIFRSELLQRSVNLLFGYLCHKRPKGIRFFIDSPISFSGLLAEQLNKKLNEVGIEGNAELHHSADYQLTHLVSGILATSDSNILDKTSLPALDLAGTVLYFHFEPDLYDLRIFTTGTGKEVHQEE